ncbi:MAG TPA: 5'/3'-nucleotidase SurE, partial [Methyloceanibacter sp.]|nr:5'/3'-nucleotidase SurE [Methyloceanibacter sp.]
WIGVERRKAKPPKGTDLWAVHNKLISVTPLCLDYTDQPTREKFAKALGESAREPEKAHSS